MFSLIFPTLALLALRVTVVFALPSVLPDSAPVTVNLRIEGETSTIFEGFITTAGEDVTTQSGGTHLCDGTNNGVNSRPGGTCTTALSDAANSFGFSFDGTFDTEFDDFFITSIGGDTETSTEFWGLLLNYQFTPVGGCQQEVSAGDDVLWAFNAFNANYFLELSGPTMAIAGVPITVTVIDGSSETPIDGATVYGSTTGPDGTASITFQATGTYTLKATAPDSIRSNALTVVVV